VQIATIDSSWALPGAEPVRYRDAAPLDGFNAVLWKPSALFAEYAPELAEDGALSVGGSQVFFDDLRRRKLAMRALFKAGGTLVIEPPLPDAIRVHTLEAVLSVTLSQVLPVDGIETASARPRGLCFRGGAPFRAFWESAGHGFAPIVRLAAPGGEVLFREDGGTHVFGLYWAQQRGRVLFLPPPHPDRREQCAAALAHLLEALAGDADERLPAWARSVVTPDEQPVRMTLERLEGERDAVDGRIADARRAIHRLERRKFLFAGAGRSLIDAVSEAFWTLGCSVLQGPFGDADLVIEHAVGDALALVVASDGQIDGEVLNRLDGWIVALEKRAGRRSKGLLVINPYRRLPPDQRLDLPVALGDAAAALGHLIITGIDLFGVILDAGEAASDKHAAVAALFQASGSWRSATCHHRLSSR
jgi:hypothetical protein